MPVHNDRRIKSPLRYPGGKSRVSDLLLSKFPEFSEYREPFVGGGSVFINAVQTFTGCKEFWINDLFFDLYSFWKGMQSSPTEVIEGIRKIKNSPLHGKEIFHKLVESGESSVVAKASEFFALNRMTFSGTTMSGGFSQCAFEKRFTDSSIERCKSIAKLLDEVKITNLDYSELLKTGGSGVFVFMDPPYYLGSGSNLYGNNGNMHSGFDHERFFRCCRECEHKWMITYNDCEFIRELYSGYQMENLEFSYGMGKCKSGKEIIIKNY